MMIVSTQLVSLFSVFSTSSSTGPRDFGRASNAIREEEEDDSSEESSRAGVKFKFGSTCASTRSLSSKCSKISSNFHHFMSKIIKKTGERAGSKLKPAVSIISRSASSRKSAEARRGTHLAGSSATYTHR